MALPIEDVIPDIKTSLAQNRHLVIHAPPGAGKTTLVPLALMDEDWLSGEKIVMLEPRRIAVRASANRMAELIREPVGKTIGYHIRMDKCSGLKMRSIVCPGPDHLGIFRQERFFYTPAATMKIFPISVMLN